MRDVPNIVMVEQYIDIAEEHPELIDTVLADAEYISDFPKVLLKVGNQLWIYYDLM